MAAYAAIVSLMNNMEQIMNHPHLSNCFDNEQVQSLLQKVASLLEFIEGYNYNHGGFVTAEAEAALERQIACAAHAAEDVVESHLVDQIHAGALCSIDLQHVSEKKKGGVRKEEQADVVESHVVDQIHAGISCSINLKRVIKDMGAVAKRVIRLRRKEEQADVVESHLVDLQQVIEDMGAVAKRAMEVKKKGGVREEEQAATHPRIHDVESGGNAMVGLEDELNQLLDWLTDHHSNCHVISIVGMGGTGKTTLAQNLYVNPLIKEHFDIRGWATISQQYDSQDILSQLISCLGRSNNVGELGEQIHKTLCGRRYLIVLDDIWGVDAWDKVRRYFPDDGNRSRVILTTRLSNVASVCGSTCFNLNLLDEDKSWKLFCEKALFPYKDDPLQLEEVAKRIVKSCKGLALSIVVIAGLLLKSPRSVGYWENVLKDLVKTDSKEKQQGLDVLSLSYTHLPPHLKPCFLYMGVFDEDSRIRASKITKLWVAEGFIKPNGSSVLEEIGEEYLKDLSDRNLILGVERRFNGKIKTFSIHDLLRDLCVKVGTQQEFFHVEKSNGDMQGMKRRLVGHRFITKFENAFARSIFFSSNRVMFVKCKLLRVLDAKGEVHMSPEELYGNVNLRLLTYRLPYIFEANRMPRIEVELPISACLVWNVQALIIKVNFFSRPLTVAPIEIWKMQQLRHVECKDIYVPDPPTAPHPDCMENLQTLRTAVNLRMSEELCEIIPNIKKLGLIYRPQLRGYDDSLIKCLCNLDRLHKLESLNMSIKTTQWRDPEMHSKLAFPLSLSKLCLRRCNLSWEDMSMIGSLPQLQVLYLYFKAVGGTDKAVGGADGLWSPVSGEFLRLKFLEIDDCDLCAWDADSTHFPVLEKLLLRRLYSLKEIPLEIGEIPTLELIHVDRCSKSAAISAVKIKKDQLENHDNHALQIEVTVYASDMESFKKRLEEEELALDLFKLRKYLI